MKSPSPCATEGGVLKSAMMTLSRALGDNLPQTVASSRSWGVEGASGHGQPSERHWPSPELGCLKCSLQLLAMCAKFSRAHSFYLALCQRKTPRPLKCFVSWWVSSVVVVLLGWRHWSSLGPALEVSFLQLTPSPGVSVHVEQQAATWGPGVVTWAARWCALCFFSLQALPQVEQSRQGVTMAALRRRGWRYLGVAPSHPRSALPEFCHRPCLWHKLTDAMSQMRTCTFQEFSAFKRQFELPKVIDCDQNRSENLGEKMQWLRHSFKYQPRVVNRFCTNNSL